jgi:hypothetical protein
VKSETSKLLLLQLTLAFERERLYSYCYHCACERVHYRYKLERIGRSPLVYMRCARCGLMTDVNSGTMWQL